MKEQIQKNIKRIQRLIRTVGSHHTGAYAAQSAYFFVLSMIPIILLLLTAVQYTPLTKADVMTAVVRIFPKSVDGLIVSIVNQVYNQSQDDHSDYGDCGVVVCRKGSIGGNLWVELHL